MDAFREAVASVPSDQMPLAFCPKCKAPRDWFLNLEDQVMCNVCAQLLMEFVYSSESTQ